VSIATVDFDLWSSCNLIYRISR